MHNQISEKHPSGFIALSVSRGFERLSFYGVRALIVVYLTGKVIEMPMTDAFKLYGWFSTVVLASGIVGALVGDLVLGNRQTAVLGAALQSLGAFVLSIPNEIGLYAGLILVALGSGLYTPNFLSSFGKCYMGKPRLLDAGFTTLYVAVNVGALLGPVLIGVIAEFNFSYAFIGAGISMLVSSLVFLTAKSDGESASGSEKDQKIDYGRILIVAFIIASLWGLLEISGNVILDIQIALGSALEISNSILSFFSGTATFLPFGVIAAIIWSWRYSSSLTKLVLGLLIFTASTVPPFFIPDSPGYSHLGLYMLSGALLGLGELFINPVLLSTVVQYSNPKYLAIVMSLTTVPIRLVMWLMVIPDIPVLDHPKPVLVSVSAGLMIITTAAWLYRKKVG